MTWMHGKGHPWTFDLSFRTSCAANIEGVVKRAEIMACKIERETVSIHYEPYASSCSDRLVVVQAQSTTNMGGIPVVQTVTNLISTATNPVQLMRMSEVYHPWF
jgi:transformation/transcription domain-associated protein